MHNVIKDSQRFDGSIPDTDSEIEIDHCRIYNQDFFSSATMCK